MANTTTERGRFITIVPDGSTDWVWSSDLSSPLNGPGGLQVKSIRFTPSGNDILVIRERTSTGSEIMRKTAAGVADGTRDPFSDNDDGGQYMKPYIAAADCQFNIPANVRITFELG